MSINSAWNRGVPAMIDYLLKNIKQERGSEKVPASLKLRRTQPDFAEATSDTAGLR